MHKGAPEGYLMIDHRGSPGVDAEFIRRSGRTALAVGEGQMAEAAIFQCCACQRLIVKTSARADSRNFCRQCDSFMCDACAIASHQSGRHIPFTQVLERLFETAIRGGQPPSSLLIGEQPHG